MVVIIKFHNLRIVISPVALGSWGIHIFNQSNSMFIKIYSLLFIFFEIIFLIITKSHYFMDIYT
jgi:hypothetical protein